MIRHNYLAIAVMVIANMGLGFLWYGFLFSKPWVMAAFGKTVEQMQAENTEMSATPYIINIICIICICFFISWLVQKLNINTFSDGLKLGLAVSIGTVFPVLATHYAFLLNAFASKDYTVLLIDVGMSVVSMLMISGVLAVWKKV
jgi:uncharacterized membrane protein (DUF485 family)